MTTARNSQSSESRLRYWLRVLRPLMWWLLLVLLLFAIRAHQQWMQETRLRFKVSVNGRGDYSEPLVSLDGKPAFSGQLVSLGHHRFEATHPKGVTYSTNLFVWYGGHDFGKIELKRASGALAVTVDPPAPQLSIRGPEFSILLTNCSGVSTSVPTDLYQIEAHYPHWDGSQSIQVLATAPNTLHLTPRLGALQIEANQPDVHYQLRDIHDETLSSGVLPVTITGLPEERTYALYASCKNDRQARKVEVNAGKTNSVKLTFIYGAATIETDPPGATVINAGRKLGVTPLTLSEVNPGNFDFELQLTGFAPVSGTVAIEAEKTNCFRTNLVSQHYTTAMNAARQAYAEKNYADAATLAHEAAASLSGGEDVGGLKREATTLGFLAQAELMGSRGEFVEGVKQASLALEATPGNARATGLIAEFTRKQQDLQRIAAKVADTNGRAEKDEMEKWVHMTFTKLMSRTPNSDLFDEQILRVKGRKDDIRARIVAALATNPNAFQVEQNPEAFAGGFVIHAKGSASSGWRRCDLVGGSTTGDDVILYFKVFEYAYKATANPGTLSNSGDESSMIPIHKSKISPGQEDLLERRDEGIRLISQKLTQALQAN